MIGLVARMLVVALAVSACGRLPSPGAVNPRAEALEPAERPSPSEVLATCLDPASAGQDPLPAGDAAAQIAEITARVEELRELRFGGRAVTPEFVSRLEISRRVAATLERGYSPEEADADRRIYSTFGAVPPDIDLRVTAARLVAGGTVGFYDPESDQLVVATRDREAPLGPREQSILAHELTHAVVDAAFGLPRELLASGAPGASLAALALVEGDAVLVERRFTQSGIPGADLASAEIGVPAGVPYVLNAAVRFPYVYGAAFACVLFREGGFPAVDAAYGDPPTTTAQVLFPERYLAREPAADPRDLGVLPAPWQRGPTDTFGAADLLWLFEAPGDEEAAALDDPLGSAFDWAGGEVQLWTDGPRSAVGVALVDRGAGELCDAVSDWYEAAFPDDERVDTGIGEVLARDGATQDAVLRCGGAEVRLGIAPDLATARALAA